MTFARETSSKNKRKRLVRERKGLKRDKFPKNIEMRMSVNVKKVGGRNGS